MKLHHLDDIVGMTGIRISTGFPDQDFCDNKSADWLVDQHKPNRFQTAPVSLILQLPFQSALQQPQRILATPAAPYY